MAGDGHRGSGRVNTAAYDYEAPGTLDDAYALAAQAGAVLLAGGQSLITDLKRAAVSPSLVVDLSRIESLRASGSDGFGAMVTLDALAADPGAAAPSALTDALECHPRPAGPQPCDDRRQRCPDSPGSRPTGSRSRTGCRDNDHRSGRVEGRRGRRLRDGPGGRTPGTRRDRDGRADPCTPAGKRQRV